MTLIESHRIEIPVDVIIGGIMIATLKDTIFEEDGKFFRLSFPNNDPESKPEKIFYPEDWEGAELIEALKVVRKFYDNFQGDPIPDKEFEPLPPGVESKIIVFDGKPFGVVS